MQHANEHSQVNGQSGVGALLRDWRSRRGRSQMDLALDVGVSTRHLSFIETGRSRPSPAMLEALTGALEVPLRERNRLLLVAGYAPRYTARALDDAGMQQVRNALDRLLLAHEPHPGLVLDRQWNVVLANRSATALAALLPEHLKKPDFNMFRASLHPQGLAELTENFAEWATYLLQTLRRTIVSSGDAALAALEQEVLAYPNVAALASAGRSDAHLETPLLVPCVLRLPHGRLSMFTTLTTFGTPRDITLEELSIELFYPADESTEALLRGLAA
ncbi:helix-turn-helix transcriptional regulator [Variovorax sp. RTB1]|uniref:helix-turn-helix domain-containing protein n=1 Tax=Variovorax sp. RTB1 TaxID=3048631 RepID=UPI002B238951|nr:helix-turn-helix transcriptional regulator [Variovorax sp. RTB1]MEB0113539.1 helix-turn-helix transcriptional regulator [Variovorax sp. RTB1]